MKILYSPQRSDEKISYTFEREKITVEYLGQTDSFDFTGMPDEKLQEVKTTLSINPIISAERVDGELRIILLYFHRAEATHDELFPQWQEV